MKLAKAIELLSQSAHGGVTTFNPDFNAATKLLIEAAIRIREGRQKDYDFFGHLLPGETPDSEGD